ncbi:MAG: aldo/keto reductase [Thiohalophilus sp.]|uniref:aldo/keto reductase n=1 Tax=Thiohalophilus sp. TaxID=3028392 RepID=UPI00286FB27D|nr:aldo/keto reductase [Thiohalophilus sp.]MDR9436287.1 aldo/keto reductase [Thiohalophilus sp.]
MSTRNHSVSLSRRRLLQQALALALSLKLPGFARADKSQKILRKIPASGENLPAIGMGTWLTFGIDPDDRAAMQTRTAILKTFFEQGGEVIDSSPMYGTAEKVLGECLKNLPATPDLFAATKVWTSGWRAGVRQMERSRLLWGVERFDLMQVHNLLDWQTHMATLREWKAAGRIRYLGVTTSHGRRHAELASIMETEPLDFVQLTYNLLDREAEQRLLPLARERGIAVLVNRPFQGGGLFRRFESKPLPAWAAQIDCTNWAQFFLKFIISHPAVTCAIPATSQVAHMRENMGAGYGRLPDAKLRRRMIEYVRGL